MQPYPRRRPFDPTPFQAQEGPFPARYGLPPEVRFCTRCVISNQRPNSVVEFKTTAASEKNTINLDAHGVCDACRVAEAKQDIDWEQRRRELEQLCGRYRSRNGSYDCIVPGSGGKDSFYTSWMLKYAFGMHPLTVTWAPHLTTPWGWQNFQAWIHSGFDNLMMTPDGRVHRLLTRLAVENLLHPFQPFVLGQKNMGPRMALQYGVKLVFYGESEAEYGNPSKDFSTHRQDHTYFAAGADDKLFLSGLSLAELNAHFGLDRPQLQPYLPLDPDQLERAGVVSHHLGYYLPWHPQGCYYHAVEHGGFRPSPERTPGTYSKYNSIDDKMDDFHYYTLYAKFGIGRATYDAAQEIRNDEITREEGVALVRKFDGEFPERFAEEVFTYLSIPEQAFPKAHRMFGQPLMDRAYFDALVDTFRSPHLWRLRDDGQWQLRHTVFGGAAE